MTERQLQFRVGLLVITAAFIGASLVVHFGDIDRIWKRYYVVAVRFDAAPGVHPSSPVLMSGLTVGHVRDIYLDQERGGVNVLVEIQEEYRLKQGTTPRLTRSLLGDSTIELVPGTGEGLVEPGTWLVGERPVDPMEIVARIESRTEETLQAFAATSDEWRAVAVNLNTLMETNEGGLDLVVERAAQSLHEFTLTMQNANRMIGETTDLVADPQIQASLKQTMTSLPLIVDETRQTLVTTRTAINSINRNLENVSRVTGPLAERGETMVVKLDNSLTNLDLMLAELSKFSRLMAQPNGTLQQFVSDPDLYRDLERSAASLALVLKNLEPVIDDMRIFSDKIARHPEQMGVGGAVWGSSGLKEPAGVAPVQATPTSDRFRLPGSFE